MKRGIRCGGGQRKHPGHPNLASNAHRTAPEPADAIGRHASGLFQQLRLLADGFEAGVPPMALITRQRRHFPTP
jgi:hypothetical protein